MSAPETVPVAPVRWPHAADRLARYAWRVLLVAIGISLAGGIVVAMTWRPAGDDLPATDAGCEQPPCLGLDLSTVRTGDILAVAHGLGSLAALVLALPSLPAGVWDLLQGRRRQGRRRLLAFAGPALIVVGTEVVPHVLLPCGLLPWACEDLPQHGLSVTGRWHLLDHMLAGAVPLAAVYWLALWRPWYR